MKERFTDNLNIKSFLVVYSIVTAIAYSALYYCYHGIYNKFVLPYDHLTFPLISTVIIGVFIAIKIFLTFAFIKDKSENTARNLTAVIETDFAFLMIFLPLLVFTFIGNLRHLSNTSGTTNQYILIGVFAGTIILTCAYNILTICTIICRREILKAKGMFHFFVMPIYLLLILIASIVEIAFIFSYYSAVKPRTNWWALIITLFLYSISFVFLFILAKKSKLTKAFSNGLLITTITLRVIYFLFWILIFGFELIIPELFILIMSIPFLSGAIAAKLITNKIQ